MSIWSYLIGLFSKIYRRRSVSTETETLIKKEWTLINSDLLQNNPSQLKQALIRADKSLDRALADIFDGENMGARLKNAKDRFDSGVYNKIWEGHKVRNALVHEAGYEPPYFMVREAIENLRGGLSALGVNV